MRTPRAAIAGDPALRPRLERIPPGGRSVRGRPGRRAKRGRRARGAGGLEAPRYGDPRSARRARAPRSRRALEAWVSRRTDHSPRGAAASIAASTALASTRPRKRTTLASAGIRASPHPRASSMHRTILGRFAAASVRGRTAPRACCRSAAAGRPLPRLHGTTASRSASYRDKWR